MYNKSISPLVIVFLLTAGATLIFKERLQANGIDWKAVMGGNIFVYLVTVFSMNLLSRGLNAENTHGFLRNAYSGILLKLFACAGAAFIYILVSGDRLNKPALFISMGFYLVYSIVEMTVIMKQSKQNKNARN